MALARLADASTGEPGPEYLAPPDLTDPNLRADYLIVTARLFWDSDSLSELARSHEANDGLEVVVAHLDDVVEQYPAGSDDVAVRDFLRFAHRNWSCSFALLVGDATESGAMDSLEDPPDHSLPSHLEPSFVDWEYRTYAAASDNYFADLAGYDRAPEIAVGRIPASTEDELATVVHKTLSRQATWHPWQQTVSFFGGFAESPEKSEDVRKLFQSAVDGTFGPSGWPADILMRADDQVGWAAEVTRRFGGGLSIYFGHGGPTNWEDWGPPQYAELANSPRFPIVVSLACRTGWFDPLEPFPGAVRSMAESLLFDPDAGAAAVIANVRTTDSWNDEMALDSMMAELRLSGSPQTVGEWIARSKRAYLLEQVGEDFAVLYNLLGDPALSIARPADPPWFAGPARR